LCCLLNATGLSFVPPSFQKSELERRFEELFSEVFRCDWRKHLQDEYHVQIDGQNFFIDYVYIGQGRKIAIELDGHGKIKGAADSTQKFHDLLARQNDLIGQGFEVYRFGWHHVVSMGGWRARHDLKRIFRGLIQPDPLPAKKEKPHPVFTALPVLWKPRPRGQVDAYRGPRHTQGQQQEARRQSGEQADIIEAQVFSYPPPHNSSGMMKGFVVGVALLGLVMVSLEFIRSQNSQQATKPNVSIVEPAPTTPPPSRLKEEPKKQPIVQREVLRTVYVPVYPKAASTPSLPKPATPAQPEPKPLESKLLSPSPEPVKPIAQSAPPLPVESAPVVDEIVAFNRNSGIYHQLHCTWAKRCRHCITIHRIEAEQMGGRPAKTCDPL
jgi:hypothetical protein